MKKILTIALAVFIVLSVMVVGVYAEETATESGPQFSREGMPQRGQFDPNNMPQRGQFDPNNMPRRGEFNPENMPQFDPSTMPQGEMPKFGGERPQGGEVPTNREEDSQNSQREEIPEGQQPTEEQQPTRNEGMPGGMQFGGMPGAQQQAEKQPMTFMGFIKAYTTPIIAVVMLGLAFLFVGLYRRKNY